jgi:hypothetical protein
LTLLRTHLGAWLLALAVITDGSGALAQAAAAGRAEARQHFQAGVAHAERGALSAALAEFEAAFAAQPHFSVLYNIGQAHAALGHPVEAVSTFERYLSEGGAQVGEARRAEVESLLQVSRRQIGLLELRVAAPARTQVWLDGRELSAAELVQPLRLAAGTHHLLYGSPSGPPHALTLQVRASETTQVDIPGPPDVPLFGTLLVHCEVPGVEISLDGVARATTPVAAPLQLVAGSTRLRFNRAGYRPVERSVVVPANGSLSVRCDQRLEPRLPPAVEAKLKLQVSPSDAEVQVDGVPLTSAALPAGPHHLKITRDGFAPLEKLVDLRAKHTTELRLELKPTRATLERQRTAAARRRTQAYALSGVGAALLLAGGGVYLWNSRRYDEYQAAPRPNLERAVSIQRADDLALGLLIGGACFGAGGAWLFSSR